jgi:hypothetical protein
MQASVTHILPLTHIKRARLLPHIGRVLVKVGQKVSATDVIAEAQSANEHVLVDVRRTLGLSRSEKLSEIIERRAGEKVQRDDVLAQDGQLIRRVVRAPVAGEIISITNGQILIEVAGPPTMLRAGFSGEVREIIPDRGAIVEADGALVQGVWGNGKVEGGVLLMLARTPDDTFTKDRLDVSMRGAVVVSGHCSEAAALQSAAQLPLRGLVLSSMTADLLPVARELSFPVMLMEGFGQIPINQAAFKIITTNEKRDLSLNADVWDPYTGARPELLISLPAAGQIAPEVVFYKTGQAVRIQSAPFAGHVGTLTDVPPGMVRLENGLRVMAAEVRLENNELINIPLANLDVLE